MAISRRGWLWIGGVVAVAVAVVVALVVFLPNRSNSDCATVRSMIDYNRSQSHAIGAASDAEKGTEASVGDYQKWADQMQKYAAQIKDPALADHAHRLADLATKTVSVVQQARSDDSGPLAPTPPPWAKTYAEMQTQSHTELVALNAACPA